MTANPESISVTLVFVLTAFAAGMRRLQLPVDPIAVV